MSDDGRRSVPVAILATVLSLLVAACSGGKPEGAGKGTAVPDVPGINNPMVVSAWDVLNDKIAHIGNQVVARRIDGLHLEARIEQLVHRLLGKERGERVAGVAVQLSRMSKEVRR